jgi:hypothetical protein
VTTNASFAASNRPNTLSVITAMAITQTTQSQILSLQTLYAMPITTSANTAGGFDLVPMR